MTEQKSPSPSPTPSYSRIVSRHFPEWLRHFRAKNLDYTSDYFEPHRLLGVPGQFSEIWRKVWKLKKAMWDGEKLEFETPREILQDMIGHCFLAIDLIDEEAKRDAYEEEEQQAKQADGPL